MKPNVNVVAFVIPIVVGIISYACVHFLVLSMMRDHERTKAMLLCHNNGAAMVICEVEYERWDKKRKGTEAEFRLRLLTKINELKSNSGCPTEMK